MTTPRLGAPELATSQAGKEEDHNEGLRHIEQGSGHFIIKDRDIDDPPGSPVDGDCYLVATASPSGAWTGHGGDIAFYMNTEWKFIEVIEGFTFWVNDENIFLVATSASTFLEFETTTGGTYLAIANNLSDLASAPTARTNLGLGSAALLAETTSAEYRNNTADRGLSTDQVWGAAATVALSESGGNVAVDMNSGINFTLSMTGTPWALSNPTNEKVGQSGFIRIAQDATGSRLLTYGSEWKFAGGTDPTLSTAANAVDVLFYQVLASGEIYANLVKAIA